MTNNKTQTIQNAAQEMLDNLEYKKRMDGTEYISFKISVAWQENIIRKARGKMLPDDYKYKFVKTVLSALADSQAGREDEAIKEIEPDVYTGGLVAWLNRNNDRACSIDEAMQEDEAKDGFNALSIAQQLEKQEVARLVLAGIREYIEE